MKIHVFEESDLRMLASLAIDLYTDDLLFKIFKVIIPKENYWAIDCRFTHTESGFENYYDSLHINCGADNDPTTYQMAWCIKRGETFKQRPITSPLLVVHQFEEMCKKSINKMN